MSICPECKGEGTKPKKPCNVCKGEGRIKAEEKIKIFIPAGIDTNQVIKTKGKGDAGRRGGEPGDLYVRIRVKQHSIFFRKGDDLYLKKSLFFSQAALGDEIEIPTLGEGKTKNILLKIPNGIESGKILRVSGKGIPHFTGFGKGNMYVELEIKTPKHLTRKQKELLKELKKEGI
jgi:molecular chaperone DnaJ